MNIVDPPYLPPLPEHNNVYTLALDLDETLIHYQEVRYLKDNRVIMMVEF